MTGESRIGPQVNVRGTRGILVLLLGLLSLGSCSRKGGSPFADCLFPAPPRSAIASALPSSGDSTFAGHVLATDATPVAHAMVRIDPGSHLAQTDSSGRFKFSNVPRGRYAIKVLALGQVQAIDTVTFGEHGVEVVAVLAQMQPGLQECVRPGLPRNEPSRLEHVKQGL